MAHTRTAQESTQPQYHTRPVAQQKSPTQTTNGQWDTEVLANLMFDWMFRGGGDSGRGSTIAFFIMVGVIPIMLWNLKRFKTEDE